MVAHTALKKSKRSIAALRKKRGDRLLTLSDADLKKDIEKTCSYFNAILTRNR